MLIPNFPACSTATSVREPRSSAASIIGGSSESDATALAVAPAGPFGPIAVTTVTAGGKNDNPGRGGAGTNRGLWVMAAPGNGAEELLRAPETPSHHNGGG